MATYTTMSSDTKEPPKNPYSHKRKSESPGEEEDTNFDHATQSKRSRHSAFVHFDDYQKEKNEDIFEELKDLDRETQDELVLSRLISFCAWFASKAIPQKNSKNKTLGVDTKKQYFSSIKEEIRNDTKDFSIWENHEEE